MKVERECGYQWESLEPCSKPGDMEGWHRWCQWCGMRESYKRNLYEWNDKRKSLQFRRDLKLKELGR